MLLAFVSRNANKIFPFRVLKILLALSRPFKYHPLFRLSVRKSYVQDEVVQPTLMIPEEDVGNFNTLFVTYSLVNSEIKYPRIFNVG